MQTGGKHPNYTSDEYLENNLSADNNSEEEVKEQVTRASRTMGCLS